MFESIAKRKSRNKCGMTKNAEAGMTENVETGMTV